MEPIIIELGVGGVTKEDAPHEGEEFGYVLTGNIILQLGDDSFKVKKGECFYFKPFKQHYIINNSKKAAKVLWVVCPHSF